MRRKLFSALIAGLLIPGVAAAGCEGRNLAADWSDAFAAKIEAEADATPYGDGRFWEVERDGATSVLFGTIHLADEEVATPPQALLDRVERASEVLVEVTLDEEKRMMRSILLNPSRILAPEDRTLSDTLTSEEFTEITTLLDDYGINPGIAERMAPWYLVITLSNPACLIADMTTGGTILDRRIEALAIKNEVPVGGLESFEDVFDLFATLPYDAQIELLRASLPTFALAEDYLETTRQLYLDGEIAAIQAFAGAVLEEDIGAERAAEMEEALFGRLLDTRNRRWVETLEPKLAEGDRVVAVGALHLGGEAGLLRLLEDRGFTVRRLAE